MDFYYNDNEAIEENPLFRNNFSINGVNTNFRQKNFLEKILTNLNDFLMRKIIMRFNTDNNYFFHHDAHIYNQELIDRFIVKMVVTGGKAINYHLPLKYVPHNPAIEEAVLLNDPKTNIISFDYDIHLIIYDNLIEKAININDLYYIISPLYNISEYEFMDYCRNNMDYHKNTTLNNFLQTYCDSAFHDAGGDLNKMGNLLKHYLSNIYNVFNNSDENKLEGNQIFNLEEPDDIILRAGMESNVFRINLPISYTIDGTNKNDRNFPLADIAWDHEFKMAGTLWNGGAYNNYCLIGNEIHQNLNELSNSMKDKIRTGQNITAIPMDEITLLNIEGLLTIPLDVCLLNTIYFAHAHLHPPYLPFKKRKNEVKYNKIIDKLTRDDNDCLNNIDESCLDLNPRYFDKYINYDQNSWRYERHNSLRLAQELNIPLYNDDNVYNRFLNIFNQVGLINNHIYNYSHNIDYLFEKNIDNTFYDILGKGISNILDNTLNNSISPRFLARKNEIDRNVLLKDTINNNIDTQTFLAQNPELNNFIRNSIDATTQFCDENENIQNSISFWIGAGYIDINYYLLAQTEDIDIELDEHFEVDIIRDHDNNINILMNNEALPHQNITLENHPRIELLERENIQEILYLFHDSGWFFTYRVTRYFNINNMSLADHNNVEFIIRNTIKQITYTSTSYSRFINWSAFSDIEDPFYIFEYILNSNDRNKYAFLNNPLECEVLINKNLNLLIVNIEVKNQEINKVYHSEQQNHYNNDLQQKIRNKYVISVLVLTDEELAQIPVDLINLEDNNNNMIDIFSIQQRSRMIGTLLDKGSKKLEGGSIHEAINISSFENSLIALKKIKKKSSDDVDSIKYKNKYLKYKNKYLKLKHKKINI